MTCRHCGAPDPAEAVELEQLTYAAGYAQGHADAAGLGPAHPAVADSVARMFSSWDGPDAAHARSIVRFQQWREEVTADDRAA